MTDKLIEAIARALGLEAHDKTGTPECVCTCTPDDVYRLAKAAAFAVRSMDTHELDATIGAWRNTAHP